jgi:predicted CXXCH cytochrome family protein
MKNPINQALAALVAAGAMLLLMSLQTAVAAFGDDATLDSDDCIKCHTTIVQQVQEAGNKHKSEVSCMDCHDGKHPPGTPKGALIPECARCHTDEPHFQLQNCMSCHTNPHMPLNITLEGEGQKAACNTCHPTVVQEIDTHKSAHAGFSCSFCHEKHRYRPDCLDCHDPHAEGQQFENCVTCHQAHQPLTLAFTRQVENTDCGACHGDVRSTLEGGETKHAEFLCVFCHADKHGFVPACQNCHDTPHSEKLLSKFKSCNDCHISAHSLLK